MKKNLGLTVLAAAALALTACGGASSPITGFADAFKKQDSTNMAKYVGGSYEKASSSSTKSGDEVAAYIWEKTVKAKTVKVGDGTHNEEVKNDDGTTKTAENYVYSVTVEGYSYATLVAKYLVASVGSILGANGWTKDNVDTELKSMSKSTNTLSLTTYKDADKGWVLEGVSATALSAALIA